MIQRNFKGQFIKGQKPWNKGKKLPPLTEERKKKLSRIAKEKGFGKGNKGKKLSKEHKKKISEALLGKFFSEETKLKMSAAHKGLNNWNKGEKAYNWKGDKVGYGALHDWVRKSKGRPAKCEYCGKDGLTDRKINWANKNHTYKRNLSDWLRLCYKCHRKYDNKYNNGKKNAQAY